MPDPDAAIERGEAAKAAVVVSPCTSSQAGRSSASSGSRAASAARGELVEGLGRPHQVEVALGAQLEQLLHLIEHLAMLGGGADDGLEALRPLPQHPHHGGHLDRLRPGAVKDEDA